MYNYGKLEQLVLSTILLKPELIEDKRLEDKYFISSKRIWSFMKAFYKKFGNFDFETMCLAASNKYKIMMYITELMELEPVSTRFDEYLNLMIELYNEEKKEKWLRNRVYDLATEFYLKTIDLKTFNDSLNRLYKNSEEIFKN